MKRLILLGALVLVVSAAFASLKPYTYPEISVEAPAELKINKWDFKDAFPTAGCCYLQPNAVAVMVLTKEKLPDLESMQKTMVKLSGIELKNWQAAGQSGKKGWTWVRECSAEAGDQFVYSLLGQSGRHAYLIMLRADKRLRVSSVRGTPR